MLGSQCNRLRKPGMYCLASGDPAHAADSPASSSIVAVSISSSVGRPDDSSSLSSSFAASSAFFCVTYVPGINHMSRNLVCNALQALKHPMRELSP